MSDSIYPKEVEELKALTEDTQETCELARLITANLDVKRAKKGELFQLFQKALEPTGT